MIVDKNLVAADVELIEAQRVGRGLGDGFELLRGPRHGGTTAWVKDFERADRRQHDRQPQPAPEAIDRGVDPAHVAQHAGPERQRIEGNPVAPQRGLALGAADDVIPVVLVEVLARLLDDFVQDLEFGAGGAAAQTPRRVPRNRCCACPLAFHSWPVNLNFVSEPHRAGMAFPGSR